MTAVQIECKQQVEVMPSKLSKKYVILFYFLSKDLSLDWGFACPVPEKFP